VYKQVWSGNIRQKLVLDLNFLMCGDPIQWNSLHSRTDDNWYFPMITVCTTLVAHTLGVTLFNTSRLLHHYLQLSMTEKSLRFEGAMQTNL